MAISDSTRRKASITSLPTRDEDNPAGYSRVTPIKGRQLSKAEQEVLQSNALDIEQNDLFRGLTQQDRNAIVQPTYNPIQLMILCQQNNTLAACIEATVVNIDGTGWTFAREDEEDMTDKDWEAVQPAEMFFRQPWPRETFMRHRRALRRDMESIGYAFLEVVRDAGGRIALARPLEAKLTYLVQLDEPAEVVTEIERGGRKVMHRMMAKERRYAQVLGNRLVYFRDFGTSRALNRETGEWETKDKPVPRALQASEVVMFGLVPDVITPYYLPRWISQVPSVLGSRRAEEFNLEWFNNGGLPPVVFFVSGGALSKSSRTALSKFLAADSKFKQRGVVVEITSLSGDLAAASKVELKTERFGDVRGDALFGQYDQRCADHIRSAFRISDMFLGKAAGYSFATAYTQAMLDEAQVFKPERDNFDAIINVTLMRELAPGYVFKSLPLSMKDVQVQLNALGVASQAVTRDSFVTAVNEAAGLKLVMEKQPEQDPMAALLGQMGADGEAPPDGEKAPAKRDGQEEALPPPQGKAPSTVKVASDARGRIVKMDDGILLGLADDWAAHLAGDRQFTPDHVVAMARLVKSFNPRLRKLFNGYVGQRMVPGEMRDAMTTIDTIAAAAEALES